MKDLEKVYFQKKDLKTFYFRTYGCQMNESDSEIMIGMLERRGMTRTDSEMDADLLIFNTCSIRDLAERKVLGKLGQLGRSRQRSAVIGVTGCMATAKKESLFRKLPHIDFVLGPSNIHELNSVIDEVLATGKQTAAVDAKFSFELDYSAAHHESEHKAYVTIIRGCNKFCTYCVVPYTRGPEVSRSPDSIVEECQRLVDKGYKEVMLLGQNVNSYGKDQPEYGLFHELLYRLDKINGLERVRFMTSHPCDITRELMEAVRDLPSLCEFIHFPLQAGSNRILRKMHRVYTLEEYKEKVRLFREILPSVKLGTDIIVGFPTETEEEFQQTYDAMAELRFSMAFIFAYSARKGTPAKRWKDDIPEEVKQERVHKLMALQDQIYAEERQEMLGTVVDVLVEKTSAKDASRLRGRTRCWKKVVFDGGEELIGTMQNVRVTGYTAQTLLGELIPKEIAICV